jgi:phage major head subunit gpT-like protein
MSAKGLGSRAIIGYIIDALDQPTNTWVDGISNKFTSDQYSEEYRWLGTSPVMREWIGGRDAKGFRDNGFTIKNKTFEATLRVLVDEIRRDKTGQVMARIADMATRANDHPAKLIAALIAAGSAALCYDGQYFFDTDHVEGDSGTQSNLISTDIVTPASPTAAEMETSILTATGQMYGYKDDQGEPINGEAKNFLVMAPVNMMKAVAGALGTSIILEGGASRNNLVQAMGSLGGFVYGMTINPRLSATDRWFLFRMDGATKPFIQQTEEDLSISALAEGSEEEFKNNWHLYGIKKIGNVGYGLWSGAVETIFT